MSYFEEVVNEKKKEKRVGQPYDDDWDNARIFVKFLCTFYEVTLNFSATLQVTSRTYYHEMCEIQSQLIELASSDDSLLSTKTTNMNRNYDKYWGNVDEISVVLFVSIVLDPRFKLKYLKYCFDCVYDVKIATKLTLTIEKTLHHLYVFYNGGHNAKTNTNCRSDKGKSNLPPKINVQVKIESFCFNF